MFNITRDSHESNITLIQKPPHHPVYEANEATPVREVIDFCFQDDLPDEMSLGFKGSLFVFRTTTERFQFALGLQAATDNPKVTFIVSDGNDGDEYANGEFGVRVNGENFLYYKDSSPMQTEAHCRPVRKREFGETIKRET